MKARFELGCGHEILATHVRTIEGENRRVQATLNHRDGIVVCPYCGKETKY